MYFSKRYNTSIQLSSVIPEDHSYFRANDVHYHAVCSVLLELIRLLNGGIISLKSKNNKQIRNNEMQ